MRNRIPENRFTPTTLPKRQMVTELFWLLPLCWAAQLQVQEWLWRWRLGVKLPLLRQLIDLPALNSLVTGGERWQRLLKEQTPPPYSWVGQTVCWRWRFIHQMCPYILLPRCKFMRWTWLITHLKHSLSDLGGAFTKKRIYSSNTCNKTIYWKSLIRLLHLIQYKTSFLYLFLFRFYSL